MDNMLSTLIGVVVGFLLSIIGLNIQLWMSNIEKRKQLATLLLSEVKHFEGLVKKFIDGKVEEREVKNLSPIYVSVAEMLGLFDLEVLTEYREFRSMYMILKDESGQNLKEKATHFLEKTEHLKGLLKTACK